MYTIIYGKQKQLGEVIFSQGCLLQLRSVNLYSKSISCGIREFVVLFCADCSVAKVCNTLMSSSYEVVPFGRWMKVIYLFIFLLFHHKIIICFDSWMTSKLISVWRNNYVFLYLDNLVIWSWIFIPNTILVDGIWDDDDDDDDHLGRCINFYNPSQSWYYFLKSVVGTFCMSLCVWQILRYSFDGSQLLR